MEIHKQFSLDMKHKSTKWDIKLEKKEVGPDPREDLTRFSSGVDGEP